MAITLSEGSVVFFVFNHSLFCVRTYVLVRIDRAVYTKCLRVVRILTISQQGLNYVVVFHTGQFSRGNICIFENILPPYSFPCLMMRLAFPPL